MFSFVIGIGTVVLDNILFDTSTSIHGIGKISLLYNFAMLVPWLAIAVRRLHDTGRSGWDVCLSWIPIIGSILLIVFYLQDSQPGENQYGKNPKEIAG